MARLDPVESFNVLKDRVSQSIQNTFPIEGKRHRLELSAVEIKDDKDIEDFRSQKQAKIDGKSWTVPVNAELKLVDKLTNKVVDKRKQRIMSIPKITNRYSYIVDGNEYQLDNLWRLRPGPYSRVNQKGEFETMFNLKGANLFHMHFDPKTAQFNMRKGGASIPAYPILKELGVEDTELEKVWGKKILEKNRVKNTTKDLARMYRAVTGKKMDDAQTARTTVREFFHQGKMDPEVTKHTLGTPKTTVDTDALMLASNRLLKLSRGEAEADNRDSLMFKSLHSAEDFIAESIEQRNKDILRKIRNNIDRKTKTREIVTTEMFNKPIKHLFTNTSISNRPEQTNPLEMVSGAGKTTILGELGGITSEHRVTSGAKLVDPSHLGFLDAIHTPEGSGTGITLHMPLGAQKRGNTVVTKMINLKTGKAEDVDVKTALASNVVMPDQIKWVNGRPKPISGAAVKILGPGNEPKTGKLTDAQYAFISPAQVFSPASNLIPFMQNDSPNRSTMAGRHMEQAIPLKHRERALVTPVINEHDPNSTPAGYLGMLASQSAPIDGEVTKIRADGITLKTADGKTKEVQLYDRFPLNDSKSFLHSTPRVAVGDKVKKGQLLADSNFTRDGQLALGTNLLTGYLPYKGLNYEDGVVISESAARKLTSEHLHRKRQDIDATTKLNKKTFLANFTTAMNREQADKLDDDGVIRKGQLVKPGDTLIAAMRQRVDTKESDVLSKMRGKKKLGSYDNAAVTWEGDFPGVVSQVVKKGTHAEVHVKTEEPAQIGDKIAGSHGNKGVLTRIVPDHEMPKLKTGEHIQVALNPQGVPGRINLGQVVETAAAKIAQKTGKPYVTKNFDGSSDYTAKVKQDLKAHGLEDKEVVYDPKTNKPMGKVLVGPHYIHKLKHQIERKVAARSAGPEYAYDMTRIPKGGGPHGAQAMDQLGIYAMLSHGAHANLRDMQTYKSDAGNNDDWWNALRVGQPLPAPRPTFAYDKFNDMLRVMGVNTVKQGNSLNLVPFTDKDTLKMSNGELADAGATVMGKDLREEKGGLFDPKVTGGVAGTKWAHITLPEPMPNPLFEKSIQSLTGLRDTDMKALMKGEKGWDPKTGQLVSPDKGLPGHRAIGQMLSQIDVDKELASAQKALNDPKLRADKLNAANRKVKYLRALKKADLKPTEAYMRKYVPVLPPAMRPIGVRPDGNLMPEDSNHMYKGLGLSVREVNNAHRLTLPEDKAKLYANVYDSLKSIDGLGGHLNREHRGIIDIIRGHRVKDGVKEGKPKEGYFQDKLVKRRQDLSMRSTIIPEPDMGLDEVGLPREQAMELYKPFVTKEVRNLSGVSPNQAIEMIKNDDPVAQRALERVVAQRPVLLKRDPVLHKYGVQAFKPVLTSGKTIKVHPLVTSGFNADFDGDQQINSVIVWIPYSMYNSDLDNWSLRRIQMSARFLETVGYLDGGEFVVCNLEDFPREALLRTKEHIDFWSVPKGIKVVAIDESNGNPVLADVSSWSVHHDRVVEIVTLSSGRQIITDDDERAVYGVDASSLQWCRRRPTDSAQQFIPVITEVPWCEASVDVLGLPKDSRLKPQVCLDERFGYFIGSMIANGWVGYQDGIPKSVNFSTTYDDVYAAWKASLSTLFSTLPTITQNRQTEYKFEGSNGSTRYTITCEALAQFIANLIGKGAQGKHLPHFFCAAPKEFLLGALAGLWDTDGSMSWSNAKDKPQFMCSYQSSSLRLLQEIQHVLRLFNVSATITPAKTPKGEAFWALTVSSVDFYLLGGFPVRRDDRVACQQDFLSGKAPDASMAYSRYRLVPLPSGLARELMRIVGTQHKSIYATLSKSCKRQFVSKELAKRIVQLVDRQCSHPLYNTWRGLVEAAGLHFERVSGITYTEQTETGYDLTVPGYETFMSLDGIVLSNTMSAFVPLSTDAVKEAHRMFPSNNLFNPASGALMYRPTESSQLGLYALSQEKRDRNIKFNSLADAAKAAQQGKIEMTDKVTIGKARTTVGRALIAKALPKEMRAEVLTKADGLDGKAQVNLLTQVAKQHKNDYGTVVNRLKDLGNEYATVRPLSIGLDDIQADRKERDYILRTADQAIAKTTAGIRDPKERKKQAVKVYDRASEAMVKTIEKKHDPQSSSLMTMMKAGVKPKMDTYRQIKMAPMLMMNASGEIIPDPVRRSYSEGLGLDDYWTSMSGARKGIVQKVQSVREPGYLTKMVMNSVMNNIVDSPDCKTTKGINLDTQERDILDRYLAKDVKAGSRTLKAGTLITPDVRDTLKNNKVDRVVVRSPLRCEHGTGICSKCFGLDENGQQPPLGSNVGMLAGQALGERSTQLAMRTFHSGGIAPVGEKSRKQAALTDQFQRMQQLVQMEQHIPNSAPLATTSGTVDRIVKNPAGGHDVYVGDRRHYVPNVNGAPMYISGSRSRLLRKGDKVSKGNPLAHGPVNPHEMLPLAGINKVQNYLSGQIYDLYKGEGIRRRNVETVVKSLTNLTHVQDPGDSPEYLRGDFAPASKLQAYNKQLSAQGKRPVKHTPVLKGVKTMPLDIQTDYLARLNHEQLHKTVIDAANQGWSSNIHGHHPVPGLVYGAEFGKKYPY